MFVTLTSFDDCDTDKPPFQLQTVSTYSHCYQHFSTHIRKANLSFVIW